MTEDAGVTVEATELGSTITEVIFEDGAAVLLLLPAGRSLDTTDVGVIVEVVEFDRVTRPTTFPEGVTIDWLVLPCIFTTEAGVTVLVVVALNTALATMTDPGVTTLRMPHGDGMVTGRL